MDWESIPESESVRCNGQLLRRLRRRLGLSQAQLASKAGYSERVIRKAEASENLRKSTLQDLTKALTALGLSVRAVDLATDNLLICQTVVRAWCEHQGDLLTHCRHVLDDNIVVVGHQGPSGEAYAEEARGLEAFDRMMKALLDLFEPVNSQFGRWFVDGDHVICIRQETMRPVGGSPDQDWTTWNTHEFCVQNGKIVRIDTYSDEMAWAHWTKVARDLNHSHDGD